VLYGEKKIACERKWADGKEKDKRYSS
jgi:hypothetical protein